MGDWSGYSLSDFLLFSPRVYDRMFVLLNQDIWPWQLFLSAVGAIVVWLAFRIKKYGLRIALLALGFGWASLALAFFPGLYQAINWLGTSIAPIAGLQAAILIGLACLPSATVKPSRTNRVTDVIAGSLLIFGLLFYPLTAVVLGRGLEAAQVAGAAPDPTAIATLGLALLAQGAARWLTIAVPIAWCAFTGLTLWTLGHPEFWIAPLAAILALTRMRSGSPLGH